MLRGRDGWRLELGAPDEVEDDTETLSVSQAQHFARLVSHGRHLKFIRLQTITAEVAHILTGHPCGALSFPAVRFLLPEVATILASYEGALHLDGLWILDSIPLATKLTPQWKAQGCAATIPNITVGVAQAIDLWPPPSREWPPGKRSKEGWKLPLEAWNRTSPSQPGVFKITRRLEPELRMLQLRRLHREGQSRLSEEEQHALQEWVAYNSKRWELAESVIDDAKKATGVELRVSEMSGQPSFVEPLLVPLAEAEKRFCTAWRINQITLPTPPDSSGWYFINNQGECVGPITWRELEATTDLPRPYIYWQATDGSVPRMADISIGPKDYEDRDTVYERAGLTYLRAAELHREALQEVINLASVDSLTEFDIDSICRLGELDATIDRGVALWPLLNGIPNLDHLRGRSFCVDVLSELLEEHADMIDGPLRSHIRKCIRRL